MCEVCDIIWKEGKGIHARQYKFFLKGGWALNHCDASNAYLGYVILTASQTNKNQPHAIDFDSLREKQILVLGKYLYWVQRKLKEYWIKTDPIEQIYFAYLNESPYKKLYQNKIKREELEKELHVHFHILPRTKSMGEISEGESLGFDFIKLMKTKTFKYEYYDLTKKEELMLFLKKEAQKDGIYADNPE
jgi:hypothetical protein